MALFDPGVRSIVGQLGRRSSYSSEKARGPRSAGRRARSRRRSSRPPAACSARSPPPCRHDEPRHAHGDSRTRPSGCRSSPGRPSPCSSRTFASRRRLHRCSASTARCRSPSRSPLNAVAAYLFFTVSHDAAHHAASSNPALNRWIGRVSTPFFTPAASFSVWRFIHMQHHRFTNHDDGSDPDAYTMAGPAWQRPLRWATVDFHYMVFYLRRIGDRPRAESPSGRADDARPRLAGLRHRGRRPRRRPPLRRPSRSGSPSSGSPSPSTTCPITASTCAPPRTAEDDPQQDRRRALALPVLLYQNYHLVHHLHPLVPFYRYIRVWRRNEEAYLDGDPALSTVRGRPLTAGEYRALRDSPSTSTERARRPAPAQARMISSAQRSPARPRPRCSPGFDRGVLAGEVEARLRGLPASRVRCGYCPGRKAA